MKSTLLATFAGVALAGGSLRTDGLTGSNTATTAFDYLGGTGFSGSYQGSNVGNGVISVGSGSGLLVSNQGRVDTGYTGLSSGTGLSNVGSGAVLVTASNTGSSQIASGRVINDASYPKADLAVLSGASSSLINNNIIANGVINNAYSNTVTPSKSIDSLFSKLPNSAELDNLILSADSVALLKTIQAVGTNSALPCDQRIAYLLELLGRLKAAVAKKTFAASQVKIVIDAALKQVDRLQGLINANNILIDKLGLDALKAKLNGLLADLQNTYVSYNKVAAQIPIVQAQINGNDQQIQILLRNSDAERNRIANDKLKLADIITQINSIQARLNDLQNKQITIQTAITKGENNIAFNDKSIAEINARIADFQDQIRRLTDQADQFSSQAKDLEVKVGRLRTDISVNQAKKARILKDNADLEDRIALEKKKNIPDELDKLKEFVIALKNLVPTVESEIDRHYYYCFGEGKVQVKQTGGVVVYVVRGEAFGNYLRNLYGKNIVLPAASGDVLLNRVDIFSETWIGAFGYPFQSNAFGADDLSINGSFGCLNPNAVVTGSGTITAIGADYIECDDGNGARQRFGLGACSRLESTRKIPTIGQKFYWSGVPQGNQHQLYTGSCF